MKLNKRFKIEHVPDGHLGEDDLLQKKSRKVSVLDLVVMLTNVIKGAQTSTVGFEDADRTYRQIVNQLGKAKKVMIPDSLIESALWSCNLLHEQGKFEHPLDVKFTPWMKALVKPDGFDRKYNFIKEKE